MTRDSSIFLKIQRLQSDAIIPLKVNTGDAGLDLTAAGLELGIQKNQLTYHTGIAMEIPEGHVGLLFPRSSIAKKSLRMSNSVGVIDAGYRGEILIKFDLTEHFNVARIYSVGDRIAQLVILPLPEFIIQEVDTLVPSERGTGGFGSTGV